MDSEVAAVRAQVKAAHEGMAVVSPAAGEVAKVTISKQTKPEARGRAQGRGKKKKK